VGRGVNEAKEENGRESEIINLLSEKIRQAQRRNASNEWRGEKKRAGSGGR